MKWLCSSFIAFLATACLFAGRNPGREEKPESALILVHTNQPGCAVDLDTQEAGKTDAQGVLAFREVEPIDHYLHIRCPEKGEMSLFVSPGPGETLDLRPQAGSTQVAAETCSPLEAAHSRMQLRQLIRDAVQLRAKGKMDEAVKLLRNASQLDPQNGDLHRELGITFLLGKEWKRARVEMLESLRDDPNDADAHDDLGYALEKLEDVDGAVKEYRTAMRLEPDDSTFRQHYFEALARVAAKQAEKKRSRGAL